MLRGIDPILGPDLLHALRAMGHGDEIAVVDANYPATSNATRLIRIDGVDAVRVVDAILSVMPLDTFVDVAAARMEVVGKPAEIPEVQREVQAEIDRAEGKSWPMGSIERMAFYEHAKKAYCVITTAETRFYGCFIFTKGVIPPKE
jgi:L-fucose mutarotase